MNGLLALALAALGITASIGMYTLAVDSRKANDTVEQFTALRGAIHTLTGGNFSAIAAISDAVLAGSGLIPGRVLASTLLNPYGWPTHVSTVNQSISVDLGDMPRQSCARVIQEIVTDPQLFALISAGDTGYASVSGTIPRSPDPNMIAGMCSTGSRVSLTASFRSTGGSGTTQYEVELDSNLPDFSIANARFSNVQVQSVLASDGTSGGGMIRAPDPFSATPSTNATNPSQVDFILGNLGNMTSAATSDTPQNTTQQLTFSVSGSDASHALQSLASGLTPSFSNMGCVADCYASAKIIAVDPGNPANTYSYVVLYQPSASSPGTVDITYQTGSPTVTWPSGTPPAAMNVTIQLETQAAGAGNTAGFSSGHLSLTTR